MSHTRSDPQHYCQSPRAVRLANEIACRSSHLRRLRDFIGALQDYDEAAFKHFAAVHVGQRALHTAASTLHHKDVAGANGDGSTTIRRRGEGSASGKKNTGDSQGAESKGSQDRYALI